MPGILNAPGFFLGLAALLVVIAGAAWWCWELVLIGVFAMGGTVAISLVRINAPILYELLPVGSVSLVSGLWVIVYTGGRIARGEPVWQAWVLVIAGFISLLAAALAVRAKRLGRP